MMEGLQRWSIEIGPDSLKTGDRTEFGIFLELFSGAGILCRRVRLRMHEVQPIVGTRTQFSFQSGGLSGSGEVVMVWGTYDTATAKGDCWILNVPRCCTRYYVSSFAPQL